MQVNIGAASHGGFLFYIISVRSNINAFLILQYLYKLSHFQIITLSHCRIVELE
jgi:hypothetical protein